MLVGLDNDPERPRCATKIAHVVLAYSCSHMSFWRHEPIPRNVMILQVGSAATAATNAEVKVKMYGQS